MATISEIKEYIKQCLAEHHNRRIAELRSAGDSDGVANEMYLLRCAKHFVEEPTAYPTCPDCKGEIEQVYNNVWYCKC